MKYLSVSVPVPSLGIKSVGPKLVQPNMAMSLQEILQRFVRGEKVPVGMGDGQYDDGEEDLEKMAHADLVDKAEHAEKMKQVQKQYKKQQRELEAAEKKRLDNLAVEKINADKLAAEKSKVIP
jgi:hypothetical protein